jgi:hypothetical protein
MRLLTSILRVGLPSLQPEVHTINQLGMKNDIAFSQKASKRFLAKIGFTSVGGSVTPKAFIIIQ